MAFGQRSCRVAHRGFVSVSIAFVEFTIGLIGFSVVMTWVLNNCGGSVLMAILLHLAFDAAGGAFLVLFPSTSRHYVPVTWQTLGIAIVYSVAALVIIVATRGQLSYQRHPREGELPAMTGTVR